MIGRNEQLQQIRQLITETIVGNAEQNVLFVTGEAGIGKSTLLHAVKEECGRMPQPSLVALVECSTPLAGQDIGEVEALAPWAEIMSQLVTEEHSEKLERKKLVTDLAIAWVKFIPIFGDLVESVADTTTILKEHRKKSSGEPQLAASQQQVFQQYINFLSKLSDRTPLVLMIDDFHWADTSSTNLLFAAARQLHGKPVLFVIAYRADDATSSRAGEGHPILHIRRELERYSLSAEIGVPKMTASDLDTMLRSRYRNYQNNDEFEEWIARVSGGNALFITQFLNTLEEDGHIDRNAGAVQKGYETVSIPLSAYAVVQERLQRLNEDAKELLRYASVEGDEFTTLVLSRIMEIPQLKLLQKLRLVEETHRIISNTGKHRVYASETTAYHFSHALIHKAMYDSLLEEERELLHGAILDVLKEEWETAKQTGVNVPGIAGRISIHAKILGEDLLAAEVLLEGARVSWEEYAEEETLHLLNSIFASLDKITEKQENLTIKRIRGEALLLRAEVHKMRGRFANIHADAVAAHSLFESGGFVTLMIDAMNVESRALQSLEEWDQAERIVEAALTEAERTSYTAGRLDALITLGHLKASQGQLTQALEWYAYTLEIAHTSIGHVRDEAIALGNMGNMYDSLGDYAKAAECYKQSLAICTDLGDRYGRATNLINMGVLYYNQGEPDEARRCYLECEEICKSLGYIEGESRITNNLGILESYVGKYDKALKFYERSLEIDRLLGNRRGEAAVLNNIAGVWEALHDDIKACEYYLQSLMIREDLEDREGMSIVYLNLGGIYVRMTQFDAAKSSFEQSRALAKETGRYEIEVQAVGGLGMVEAAEANSLAGIERKVKLDRAESLMQECVDALREVQHVNMQMWEQELKQIKEQRERT